MHGSPSLALTLVLGNKHLLSSNPVESWLILKPNKISFQSVKSAELYHTAYNVEYSYLVSIMKSLTAVA